MEYAKEKELNQLVENLSKECQEIIVDFIIFDEQASSILIQKRSMSRSMFPGEWDFPGGHLEPNEDVVSCLKREVYEEGQMYLQSVIDLVHVFTWDSDKDVVNLQFLVKASGVFAPNKDKISEHRFITSDQLKILDKENQIYRGAFYAFEYIKQLKQDTNVSFSKTLFFDQLVANFFNFLRIDTVPPPKVVIDPATDKRFVIDMMEGILTVSSKFLNEYDKFACGSVILHQLFHNYRQSILTFDDVNAIRNFLGKNYMFHVDIVADVYAFLFLERYYDFTQDNYIRLCFNSIKEYQGASLEASKLTRLLGSALTVANREGQIFDVILPVLDEKESLLYSLKFSKGLELRQQKLEKNTVNKLRSALVGNSCSEKDFLATIEKIILIAKIGK